MVGGAVKGNEKKKRRGEGRLKSAFVLHKDLSRCNLPSIILL